MTTQQIISVSLFGVYALVCTVITVYLVSTALGYRDLVKGLLRILERRKQENTLEDVQEIALEIDQYYLNYTKFNPSVLKRYLCIVNWIDDVLLQTNMFNGKKHRKGSWFDEYYELLRQVRVILERRYPFYRCTSGQTQILLDIAALENQSEGPGSSGALLQRTEQEFLRLNHEQKKNERTNLVSIAIGIAGILVSVLMAVLQMAG